MVCIYVYTLTKECILKSFYRFQRVTTIHVQWSYITFKPDLTCENRKQFAALNCLWLASMWKISNGLLKSEEAKRVLREKCCVSSSRVPFIRLSVHFAIFEVNLLKWASMYFTLMISLRVCGLIWIVEGLPRTFIVKSCSVSILILVTSLPFSWIWGGFSQLLVGIVL